MQDNNQLAIWGHESDSDITDRAVRNISAGPNSLAHCKKNRRYLNTFLEDKVMPIKESMITKLGDVVEDIVNDPEGGSWAEKKEQIIAQIGPAGKSALEEFTSWFDEEDFS